MDDESKPKIIDNSPLNEFFNVDIKKNGHLYKNGIIIQDILNIKRNDKTIPDELYYFQHTHKIPIISEDINISSINTSIIEVNIPKTENNVITIDNKSIKGTILRIKNSEKYSTLVIRDNDNNDHYIKTETYSISQDITEEKEIQFFF